MRALPSFLEQVQQHPWHLALSLLLLRLSEYNKMYAWRMYTGFDTSVLTVVKSLFNSPDLTWRDVQYLIVYTSNPGRTTDLYTVNRAGILTSREFGFGLMDAEAIVTRARHWINVPPQLEYQMNSTALGLVLNTQLLLMFLGMQVLSKHDFYFVLHNKTHTQLTHNITM